MSAGRTKRIFLIMSEQDVLAIFAGFGTKQASKWPYDLARKETSGGPGGT